MKYIIFTKKIWNKSNLKYLDKKFILLDKLSYAKIKKINPKIIFFIYWSKIIPEKIFNKYLCIQFHSSDLPKYRGGSPIQNQILNNIVETKISAFKINNKIDCGNICLKEKINLKGTAQQIYINIENKIFRMIKKISTKKKITFIKQSGISSYFKRRKPEQSKINLKIIKNIHEFYNFIRCTDADEYPKAFFDYKNFKIELFDAKLSSKREMYAKIKIIKKK